MRRGATLTIALACWLLTVTPAHSVRDATPEETAAMAAARGFGGGAGCVTASVSTVDETWGRLSLTNADGCQMGDGYAILRRQGASWSSVTDMSAEYGACPVQDVPTPIAKDLRLCRNARTYLLCLPRKPPSDYSRELRRKPRSCTTLGPQQALAFASNLARLRWRGWGKRVARARGVEKGFHLPYARIRARVVAYRRRRCPFGDFMYTRLKVRTKYGRGTYRFPSDCSD